MVNSGFLVLWRQTYIPRQHTEAAEAGRKRQQQRLRDTAAVTAGKIFIQQHNCEAGCIH